jgi:hypothetical protein
MQDAAVNERFPHMATFGEALQFADPDWRPIIPTWGKINADLGTTLSKVLTEDSGYPGSAGRRRRAYPRGDGRSWLLHLAVDIPLRGGGLKHQPGPLPPKPPTRAQSNRAMNRHP